MSKFTEKGEESELEISYISRILLIPLLAFISFNLVLSPQYMIWVLPLIALTSLRGSLSPVLLVSIAIALTPIFYPTLNYFSVGLNMAQTIGLFGRNLLLFIAWIWLIIEMIRYIRLNRYPQ
jgi:hypothetical protein